MQIKLLQNGENIRNTFTEKFVMTWPQYQAAHPDAATRIFKKQADFDRALMWDRMPTEYPCVPFRDALKLLQSMPGEVQFLSEGPDYPYTYVCELQMDGQKYPHFVAAADARELADLIEFEWIEDARLFSEMRHLSNKALPNDLYICTPDFTRLLVFTHETNDWDEDPVKAAESRVCFAFGFDQ